MKLLVAKRDLQEALEVVGMTLAGSGSDISTHFLFRLVEADGQAPRVEILSHAGRTYSSCPLICTVSESDKGKMFSVAGKQFKDGLDLLDDVAVTLDSADRLVTLTVPGEPKPFRFLSLDPTTFPFWDETFAASILTATFPASHLRAMLGYAKEFISTEESQYPGMCVAEVREGTLYSTDKVGATLITAPGLEKVAARVHRNDMSAILRFLDDAKDAPIEVRETPDKTLFLRRQDGAVFGETRPTTPFPALPGVNRKGVDHHSWTLPKDGLIRAIKKAAWTAEKTDTKIRIARPDPTGPVILAMADSTGSQSEREVPVLESSQRDADVPALPTAGFLISYTPLLKILSTITGDRFTLGISRVKTTGFVRYHEMRDGDDYTTIIPWLEK